MPPLLVSPLLEPVEALKAMIPQFSAEAEFNHGPPTTLDRIISSEEIPCPLQDGKGAEILYEFDTTIGREARARTPTASSDDGSIGTRRVVLVRALWLGRVGGNIRSRFADHAGHAQISPGQPGKGS